jgi:hypothetical protein
VARNLLWASKGAAAGGNQSAQHDPGLDKPPVANSGQPAAAILTPLRPPVNHAEPLAVPLRLGRAAACERVCRVYPVKVGFAAVVALMVVCAVRYVCFVALGWWVPLASDRQIVVLPVRDVRAVCPARWIVTPATGCPLEVALNAKQAWVPA